jgi:hypothetical protein
MYNRLLEGAQRGCRPISGERDSRGMEARFSVKRRVHSSHARSSRRIYHCRRHGRTGQSKINFVVSLNVIPTGKDFESL